MNCGLQFWGGGSQHITLVFGFIIHIQSKACYVQDVKFPTDSLEPFRLPFLSEEFPIQEVGEDYHPKHFKKDGEMAKLGFRKLELETLLEI